MFSFRRSSSWFHGCENVVVLVAFTNFWNNSRKTFDLFILWLQCFQFQIFFEIITVLIINGFLSEVFFLLLSFRSLFEHLFFHFFQVLFSALHLQIVFFPNVQGLFFCLSPFHQFSDFGYFCYKKFISPCLLSVSWRPQKRQLLSIILKGFKNQVNILEESSVSLS